MADKKGRGKVPLLFAGKSTTKTEKYYAEGGPVKVKPFRVTPPLGGWDTKYVPGYSDMKLKLEGEGKVAALHMPARLQWIPIGRNIGAGRSRMVWNRMGYKEVEVDHMTGKANLLEKHGWDLPPAADIDEKGHLVEDDVVLAYCDGEQAKKNYEEWNEYNKLQSNIMDTDKEKEVKISDEDIVWQ